MSSAVPLRGSVSDLVLQAVVIGVAGTVAMDLSNRLLARAGVVTRIDPGTIGRMAAGWARGRFRYRHPEELVPVRGDVVLGWVAHYAIGVGLALPFVFGWDLLVGPPLSPAGALVYGVATTVASVFWVYPSLGLGVLGLRSPDGLKAPLSSLANHLFFGVGMAVGVLVV